MRSELRPQAVAARLDELRERWSPEPVTPPREPPPARDLSPEVVAARLAELRALDELSRYLHAATPEAR